MRFQIVILVTAIVLLIAVGTATAVARGARQNKVISALDESQYAEVASPDSPSFSTATSSTSPKVAVPILVYHIVRPQYPNDSPGVRAIAVTPETFDAELAHLHARGYTVIGFHEFEQHFASSTPLPQRSVIISFDDGWRDQFEYALPILQKYNDTATFFVFTNAIGHHGFFTWDDLRALSAAGMTIGDHTLSHPFLTRINEPAKLWEEIDGSKIVLEKQLGVPITEFAYPFGQYDPAVLEFVKLAGFKSARGDLWSGAVHNVGDLYTLSALNAPTTTDAFVKWFP